MNRMLIVTGASSGIGAGIANAASAEGAAIASVSRRSGPGSFHAADLSNPGSWPGVVAWMEQMVEEVLPAWVAFAHCAATLTPIGAAADVELRAYTDNVLLNSAAPQVLGAGFLNLMTKRDLSGVLLHISSGAATNPYPGWSSYCAAKAAVDQWTRTVGLETSRVTSMSVAPGVVATDMQAEIRATPKNRFPNVGRFHQLHEQGQLADPNEVGSKLWGLMTSGDLEPGTVADLRSM